MLRPILRQEFELRCLDEKADEVVGDEEAIVGDVTDLATMAAACEGVQGVVHLAGNPRDDDFVSELVPRNIVGSWAVLEAARRAAVPHVVLASTIQTVIGSPAETCYHVEDVAEPLNLYGCSKLFGEAAGRLYAREHQLKVACLRIGACVPPDHPWFEDATLRDNWVDPADLARLVTAIVRSDVGFATVFAVSKPANQRFDTQNPFGWNPLSSPAVTVGSARDAPG